MPSGGSAEVLLQASGPLPDASLVERVLGGDLTAFEVLMRRHNTRVYRTVRAVLRDESEVEDAMQQAYLAAFSHLREFRGQAAFSTWLLRIAHNEADARRCQSIRVVPLDSPQINAGEVSMVDGSPRPDDVAEARELTRFAEVAIDALPEALRSVLMLRGVQGLSTAEAAAVLSVSEDVVKQRLHRAREEVRAGLVERLDERFPDAFDFKAPRCDRVVAGVLAAIAKK